MSTADDGIDATADAPDDGGLALTSATSGALERAAEAALRPRRLADFVGQEVVREQLSLVLDAAQARGTAPEHMLLSGPPGLGKTTLAMIIAAELGSSLRITSGPAVQHAGDLAAILSSLEEGEVLFIDEIHRLARPAEEMLYIAMEDFRVDVMVGKGVGATSIPLELPPFTVVGATTRAGLLPAPLRDRFGVVGHLDYYRSEELHRVVLRSAGELQVDIESSAAAEIASRSRGTPRIANRLLRRVRDWAQVRGTGDLDLAAAQAALEVYEVDARGLDRLDRAVLSALCTRFAGGPVGLSTRARGVPGAHPARPRRRDRRLGAPGVGRPRGRCGRQRADAGPVLRALPGSSEAARRRAGTVVRSAVRGRDRRAVRRASGPSRGISWISCPCCSSSRSCSCRCCSCPAVSARRSASSRSVSAGWAWATRCAPTRASTA